MIGQEARRQELYGLLGRLPERDVPLSVRKVSEEEKEDFILERLVLDPSAGTEANPRGEVIPALFTRPKGEGPFPAVLFCHSHGGMYDLGKRELLEPAPYMFPVSYASALAREGIAALAIDHWCFGERSGRTESAAFKSMLWRGEVLWGRMVYDSLRALDYLVSRRDVDEKRIASLGMSMGSTMSWWTAALDERIRVCVDLCCLTDYDALEAADGLDLHGVYYFVPSLRLHFSTPEIVALIAPRPHLGTVGVYDGLTPPSGVDRIEKETGTVYKNMGAEDSFRILRYPSGHLESAAMRQDVISFLKEYL